jgi:hypothetical protein
LVSDEKEMESVFTEKNLVKKMSKQRGDWLAILFGHFEN